jgi:hypothetical protein
VSNLKVELTALRAENSRLHTKLIEVSAGISAAFPQALALPIANADGESQKGSVRYQPKLPRHWFHKGYPDHDHPTNEPEGPPIALASYPTEYGLPPFDPTVKGALSITYESCMASLDGRDKTKTLKRPIQWIHFPKCGTSFGAVVYGYVCQSDETPMNAPPSAQQFVKTNLNNLVKAETCDYCGLKAVTQGKPTLWDPNLRKQLPFRDSSHPDAPPPLKYCDWDVPPPWFPMSNHFPHAWNWEAKDYSRAPVALFRDPRKRIVSAWNNNKHSFGVGNFNNPHNKSYARKIVNDLETVFDFAQHPPIQSCQTKMMLAEVRPRGLPSLCVCVAAHLCVTFVLR